MSEIKKIIVNLPQALLLEVDTQAEQQKLSRSEWIRSAIRQALKANKQAHITEWMKKGYGEMGELNISLSEEGLDHDIETLKSYEKILERE